jgi:hypothetical protein
MQFPASSDATDDEEEEDKAEESEEEKKIKAAYLHSDVKTIERITILTDFRKGGDPIRISRVDARDPAIYRKAKALAAEQGVALEIASEE